MGPRAAGASIGRLGNRRRAQAFPSYSHVLDTEATMTAHRHYKALWLAAGLALMASPALADTGDLFQVSGARANLRSGPSDQTTVRNQLLQGEQLVELRRDGNWVGVRVMRTGEEGWIYADLVTRVQQSQLVGGAPVPPED